jgi:hypothetical protein
MTQPNEYPRAEIQPVFSQPNEQLKNRDGQWYYKGNEIFADEAIVLMQSQLQQTREELRIAHEEIEIRKGNSKVLAAEVREKNAKLEQVKAERDMERTWRERLQTEYHNTATILSQYSVKEVKK